MALRLTPSLFRAYPLEADSMIPSPRALLLLPLVFLFNGCVGGNFLIGKWTFDADATREAIQSSHLDASDDGGPAEGLLRGIVGGLQKGMLTLVISQLEGTEIEFTKEEMRRVRQGAGESQAYEIIEKVSPDRYLVQYADGEIVSWGRSGTGIKMQLGSDEEVWAYFRPVGK